jgi:hypothetical protein
LPTLRRSTSNAGGHFEIVGPISRRSPSA